MTGTLAQSDTHRGRREPIDESAVPDALMPGNAGLHPDDRPTSPAATQTHYVCEFSSIGYQPRFWTKATF